MSNDQLLLQYLKSIEDSVKRIESSMVATDTEHDGRIKSLENSRSNFEGKATIAGAIIAVISGAVSWIATHWEQLKQ